MKNTYVKPEMQVEEFRANQYVATCGKTPDGKYIFTCDAPEGNLYYYKTRQILIWQWEDAEYIGTYHPCGAQHVTEGTGNYYEGFVDRNNNRKEDDGEHVLVWRGVNGNNGHATVSLSMNEIEVVQS